MDETLLSAITDTDPEFYHNEEQRMPETFRVNSLHDTVEDKYKIKVTLRPNAIEVLEYLA